MDPPSPCVNAPDTTATEPGPSRRFEFLLGRAALLAALVLWVGSAEMAAPWIMGDEYIFIVDNPDVHPYAVPPDAREPLAKRLRNILLSVHDDLYQPIPLLTYALEVAVTSARPAASRLIDTMLHAGNALLLWWTLARLLRACWGDLLRDPATVAFPLALIWAVHPALVGAYAGDMGRTHLLSGTFALLALVSYQRHLETDRIGWFAAAVALLVAAMLSKPVVGWVLAAFALEGVQRGWGEALRSPRVWIIALLCAAFGVLGYYTTAASGLAEEASAGLFGDPLARSALAVSLYFRSIVVPLWVSFWQLPDPRTGWDYTLVWSGLGLFLVTVVHAIVCATQQNTRWATFAWCWFWGGLMPVLGLFGAREVAASDRALYQPLMAIVMLFGWLAGYVQQRTGGAHQALLQRTSQIVVVVLAVAFGLLTFTTVGTFRSPIERARRLVRENPDDPRALEAFAAALDFAQNHPLSATDLRMVPRGASPPEFFRKAWHETLLQATEMEKLDVYFPKPADRAPFHRRLAYRLLRAGDPQHSLAQAQLAWRLQPDHFSTWLRLAHAYQALFRFHDAAEAYARAEALVPDDPATQAALWTNFAYLMLFDIERDAGACERLERAARTGVAPAEAYIGLALCHIRYGDGELGRQLIQESIAKAPKDTRANLVLAEYHWRRQQWDEALAILDAILADQPAEYATLRALHEVCLLADRMPTAVEAWAKAVRQEPARLELAGFHVWAMAIAGDPETSTSADEILCQDENNRFAALAQMLLALRKGEIDRADQWVRRAAGGLALPHADEFARAAATMQILGARGRLPAEMPVLFARVVASGQAPQEAQDIAHGDLQQWMADDPQSRWRELAEEISNELSDAEASADEKNSS